MINGLIFKSIPFYPEHFRLIYMIRAIHTIHGFVLDHLSISRYINFISTLDNQNVHKLYRKLLDKLNFSIKSKSCNNTQSWKNLSHSKTLLDPLLTEHFENKFCVKQRVISIRYKSLIGSCDKYSIFWICIFLLRNDQIKFKWFCI